MIRHFEDEDRMLGHFTACGLEGGYRTNSYNVVTCKRCRLTKAWSEARELWQRAAELEAHEEELRSLKGFDPTEIAENF